jgi:RNA:NAD 2'-phosphotransferase (TPT1/KptA family)
MILYHTTTSKRAASILVKGLFTNRDGWSYLSPKPNQWIGMGDGRGGKCDTVLEVETSDARLTAFEGCEEWEVLCWAHIPAENIKLYKSNP